MMWKWLILLFYYKVFKSYVYNIEEIEHLKYGIEMNSKPVLRSQLPEVEHVIMTSKYNQDYSCIIPRVATKDNKDEDLENVFKSFASKFSSNTCIHRIKGWWTYRICYGNIIQQYHQDNPRKHALLPKEVTVIGHFEKDMNWTQELSNPSIKYYEQMPLAHKQYFDNGDTCEDTGLPRKATVSYVCDPSAYNDFIALIDERVICVYKIVIHTARMCKHDFFMPGHAAVKHKISCSPIVDSLAKSSKPAVAQAPIIVSHEPTWVGTNPTTENYSLKNYLDDISNEEKQAPIRALKKMFKNVVNEMKIDINKLKGRGKTGAALTNVELANINLEAISEEDLSKLFQSEELESTITKLAKTTQQQIEALKQLDSLRHKPKIEIKVIYRDADGNVKISDADRNSPELHDTVLQLLDAGMEEKAENKRQQIMQNAYHFVETTSDSDEESETGKPRKDGE